MTKKSEVDWDKSKLEDYRKEAEALLEEPMLLTEEAGGQIEVATEKVHACSSPTPSTKSCC
jgi:hypothetical protein